MKIRCINDLGISILEVGCIYDGELKFSPLRKEKCWYLEGEKFRKFCFSEKVFEIVKEDNKMKEKTFREVIADIKEGEVWESAQNCFQLKEIRCVEGRVKFKLEGVFVEKTEGLNNVDTGEGSGQTFKLQRKQCSFTEAFKAFEEGKEIESCEGSCYKYKRMNNSEFVFIKENEHWLEFAEHEEVFSFNEIRGKWYIND